MYIENVTELAFDDITAEDPDFPSIQGKFQIWYGSILVNFSCNTVRELLNHFQVWQKQASFLVSFQDKICSFL